MSIGADTKEDNVEDPQKNKIKIELPYNLAVLFLGIYLKKMKTFIQNDVRTCSLQHHLQQSRYGNNLSIH